VAAQKSIPDILLEKGKINQKQFDRIKLENINTGRSFEEIISTHNLVSEEVLLEAKAQFINVPFIKLSDTGISPQALSFLPEQVARRYHVLPIAYDGPTNTLSVAMADPLDSEAVDFIEKKSGCKIKAYLTIAREIDPLIDERYAKGLAGEVTAALKETAKPEEVIDITKIGKVIREAPIAKIVSTILEFAMKSRASDIHIEPKEERTRVRYRIDGILYEKLILPKRVHEAVVSRIKILSGMKIDIKRKPQDGRFNFRAGGHEVDLRVSSLPSTFGEKVVMRLLRKTAKIPSLTDLGLRGKALKNFEDAILVPQGIIIVCGPTGSGKTTTLYSALSKVNAVRVNIITIEDPVEYEIEGVTQVQVNRAVGLTFASALRSFFRQDPDIIMVGEIRDVETTELAIRAALTGHLVFSTLHTNDAAGALPRLVDMGAEPFLLASSMILVIGQRVVRRICLKCKEEYDPPPAVVNDVKKVLGDLYPVKKKLKLYRGKKCEACNQSGYSGRIGIFEVLPITEKVAKLIMERAPASKIEQQAREEGMVTMKQDGYLKAIEGVTSLEEVLRVAEEAR
jgi:type IV pilus assembly protein PilB